MGARTEIPAFVYILRYVRLMAVRLLPTNWRGLYQRSVQEANIISMLTKCFSGLGKLRLNPFMQVKG